MISGPRPDAPNTEQKYIYDAWNRMIKVEDNSSNTVSEFEYDGRNYRIQKTAGGILKAFYYNQNHQVIEERTDNNEDPINQYIWSPRYIDSPIVRFHDANTDGDYIDAGDNILCYTSDANHNITALIDSATGNIVERYHYDPYGKATYYNANWTELTTQQSAYKNIYLYTGRKLDQETGLMYYRARYYDTNIGRFISRDPLGYEAGDENLYRYCGNSPLVSTDPTGLNRWVMFSFGYLFILVEVWDKKGQSVIGYAQLHFSLIGHEVIRCRKCDGASVYNSWISNAKQDKALLDYYNMLTDQEKDSWWPGMYTPLNNCWADALGTVPFGGQGNPSTTDEVWKGQNDGRHQVPSPLAPGVPRFPPNQ